MKNARGLFVVVLVLLFGLFVFWRYWSPKSDCVPLTDEQKQILSIVDTGFQNDTLLYESQES